MSSKPPTRGPFHRENPNISIPGAAIFALGRLADAPLQYTIFTRGLPVTGLAAVGLRANNALVTAGPGIAGLGTVPTLLTGMYAIAGIRHAYWSVFTSSNYCSTGSSLQVVFYNTAVNIVNTLVAVHALTSPPNSVLGNFTDFIGWKQWAGLTIFAIGISMEMIAENSRKQFKKDLKNKGKIDDTGLWSIVRHPNYLGYLLWRIGITLTTGSLVATAALASLQLGIFCFGGIPDISHYMATKYDVQWKDYKKRVPFALFPGIL
ncbi:hypothetical protein K438DRAFT_1975775 [Mycena galopus ATCC 62051]|nr:hypothetical protein K438DRAFT_1975775 [Mycena galopus ATCC 62051]